VHGEAEQADRGVAQGGHDLWSVAGAELVTILVEHHVTHPVKGVLDGPVALDPGGDRGRWGGDHVQRADHVDYLDCLAALDGSGSAELDDLRGAGEVDPVGDLPSHGYIGSSDFVGRPHTTPTRRGIGSVCVISL
jgi:hypothetical protein